tara:strand:- start:43 stop:414 length:372 start_codon:yes stop_codon:yes gene_type:complete
MAQRFYYIDGNRLGLVQDGASVTKNNVTQNYVSVTEAKEIRIFAVAKANKFKEDVVTDTPQIPEQFHESLAFKVIAMGYKDPRNLNINLAQYFDGEFDKCLRMGKKHARSQKRRGGVIIPHEY